MQIDRRVEVEGLKCKELSFPSYRLEYHGDYTRQGHIKEYLGLHETEISRLYQGEEGIVASTFEGLGDSPYEGRDC
jgi:hypothetical protein